MLFLTSGTIELYETSHEKLTTPDGVKYDAMHSEKFAKRMPDDARGKTQTFALHPKDQNLFALACRDGSVLVKHLHLEDRYQVLHKTAVATEVDSTPTPIPHLFFTSSGNMFVLCKTIDKTEFGKPPEVLLEV